MEGWERGKDALGDSGMSARLREPDSDRRIRLAFAEWSQRARRDRRRVDCEVRRRSRRIISKVERVGWVGRSQLRSRGIDGVCGWQMWM